MLISKRISVSDITEKQKDTMFLLLDTYYENSYRDTFEKDMNEKDWVILIIDETTSQIVGFSTQMLMRINYNGKEYGILFSGDTIISKEHWGKLTLSICFTELMKDILHENENMKLYWMLISKGLRTYKFLPVCFLEYYPHVHRETPNEIQSFMHFLGKYKFPDSYDPTTGIIKALNNGQYLKKKYQPKPKAEKDYEVFFTKINPGYLAGDDLLCLAPLSRENINPLVRRIIKDI